jgi:small subunit ribosomal protein S8
MHYRLLSQLKNAAMVRKDSFQITYSAMIHEVAKVLVRAGYLKDAQKRTIADKPVLDCRIAYDNKRPSFSDMRIISKPGRHLYVKAKDLHPVRHGYGVGVISTSKGIMTNSEAKKEGVGGEYLFEIW